MQRSGGRPAGAGYVLSCLLMCGLPMSAWAQVSATIEKQGYLGDWLVEHPAALRGVSPVGSAAGPDEELFRPGTIWTRPDERKVQIVRRQTLLNSIRYLPLSKRLDAGSRDALYRLIASRPATGRINIVQADPRWLKANDAADPMLSPGDTVTIPTRPRTVTVIQTNGQLCELPHRFGTEALQYVRACNRNARPDNAWVIQPDGTVRKVAVALWNRSAQDAPAPGAWIWAPDRGARWPDDFSQRLAEFFSTQGASGVPVDRLLLRTAESEAPSPAAALTDQAAQTPLTPPAPPLPALQIAADAIPMQRPARDFPITASDWGTIGVLQTPSARFGPAGSASIGFSYVNPYARLNVMLQPLDWFEFGFRYSDVRTHAYGPSSLSGDQTYKDKSIDFRIRLWKESAYIPQFAAGMRDVGGTGLFSSEFIVASKRTGDFDWSLGLAWGNMGARGSFANPLSIFSSRFNTRPAGSGTGNFNARSVFRGRTALFGGVQYQTPWTPLILKLEYDGNNYEHEPFSTDLHASSPFNVGLVYRLTKNLDLSASFERGNRAMLGVSLHGDLSQLHANKVSDPPRLPVVAQRPAIEHADWTALTRRLEQQTGWRVKNIEEHGNQLDVSFDNTSGYYLDDRLERIATVLHSGAPSDIAQFRVIELSEGTPVASYVIRRDAWSQSRTQAVPPIAQQPTIVAGPPPSSRRNDNTGREVFSQPLNRWNFSFGPGYSQNLGGPNGFVLYRITANADAAFRLTEDTWLAGGVSYRLLDNYGHFTYDAPSKLPRVRTYLREYMTTSRFNIPYLQATHVGRISENQFYEVYGGLLEPMFGGVGAEWLYRPWQSRFAVGIDANAVRQRGFEQDFSFRSYQTFTGHLTAYWDTGWNGVHVNVSVGQYLAKDKGATLDISKVFQNGVTIGAYATKTNISSAQYGEGSFDKGIYVTIPFDALMSRSSARVAVLQWSPLTRDGGAKLGRQFPLYDVTSERDAKSFWYKPAAGTP